jgi:hypothetical protein
MAARTPLGIHVTKKEIAMEQTKKIGNVNMLDMRNATEASVAGIKKIGNVNLLIYTREKADLVQRLNTGNINLSVEVPPEARLQQSMGQTVIGRDYFKNAGVPVCILAMGQVVVERDVPVEDIEKQLAKLIVMGQLICPEALAGAVESKTRVMGQTKLYPPLAQLKIGDLALDSSYLGSLDDGTDLAVVGSLRVPQVLPNDLLQRKLGKLFVSDSILVHEENAQAVRARLTKSQGDVKVIPAGFTLIDKPLNLDKSLIEFLSGRKLFCTERVVIAADVDTATFDKYVDALTSEELVVCPVALKGALARKGNVFEMRVVFYEGELMLVDDKRHLSAARLGAVTGKATLVVTGELTIDPDVTPQMLGEKVLKVHNLGHIVCTTAQMVVVETHLGLHEGELVDSTRAKAEDEQHAEEGEPGIGNINILEL